MEGAWKHRHYFLIHYRLGQMYLGMAVSFQRLGACSHLSFMEASMLYALAFVAGFISFPVAVYALAWWSASDSPVLRMPES